MIDWRKLEQTYFMDTGHRRLDVVLVRGEDMYVWDENGKKYLDFIAGWATNSLGHCHPIVVKTLAEQSKNIILGSNDVYTIPAIQLAELLVKETGLNKVFIANSGAEANEAAVKLARKYGKTQLNGAYEVISTLNSFHGRTLAMVAATGKPEYQDPFRPLPVGFINVPYNNVFEIKYATSKQTCAVLLEPIQGEGGVNIPSTYYLQEVREWCTEKNILLILDEIQTGFGRTGSLFAYQESGIMPDILTVGKGMGGGVPVSAVIANTKSAVFSHGDHGSTFGGNALNCAVAYEVFKWMLEHNIPQNAKKVGYYLMDRLLILYKKYNLILQIRGKGLLVAIEFNRPVAMEIVKLCRDKGLLINPVKPTAIRLMPPLTINNSHIDEALKIIESAIQEVK